MKFSKKSRYGIQALIDLGIYAKTECVQLKDVSERNDISVKYLEQIFTALRKAGFVKSIKGPQGGYLLGKLPEEIRISDVVEAMDGSYELDEEVSELPTAQVIQRCIINPVNEQTNQLLQGLTLKELVEKTEEITAYSAEMYYI